MYPLTPEARPLLLPMLRVEVDASRELLINGRLCVFGFATDCLAVSMLSNDRFLGSAFGCVAAPCFGSRPNQNTDWFSFSPTASLHFRAGGVRVRTRRAVSASVNVDEESSWVGSWQQIPVGTDGRDDRK